MGTFQLSRQATVAAPRERVHALINDFRAWQDWSPWEGLDENLQRTYSGSARGVGTHYHWVGNSKAGEGTMQITASTPAAVSVDLTFLKPFKASNEVRFDLVDHGDGCDVTWTMTGQRGLVMRVLGPLFFDRAIGRDFEKGLAQLKAHAERPR